jgi:hypothetical protein
MGTADQGDLSMSKRTARKHHRRPPDTLDLMHELARGVNRAARRALDRGLSTPQVLYTLVQTLTEWIGGLRGNRTINPYDVQERVTPSQRTLMKALAADHYSPPTTAADHPGPDPIDTLTNLDCAIEDAICRALDRGLSTPQMLYALVETLRGWMDGLTIPRHRATLDAPPPSADQEHTTPDEPQPTQTLH